MRRSSIFAAICLVGLAWLTASGEDPDIIKVVLDADHSTYDKDSQKTKAKFIDNLKEKIEEGRKQGDTNLVNVVSAELQAFEGTGTLPKSKVTRRVVDKFENDLFSVMQQWKYAMEKAQKEYTKVGKQDKANHIKAEVEAFQKVIESRFPDRKRRENKITAGKFEQKIVLYPLPTPNRPTRTPYTRPTTSGLTGAGTSMFASNNLKNRGQWVSISTPRPSAYNFNFDSDGGKAGPKCLRITGDGNFGVVSTPAFKADFKTRYTASGWVKANNNAHVLIAFDYFDSRGEMVLREESDAVNINKEDNWQYFENNDRLDEIPNASFFRVALKVIGPGTAWFDDIQMVTATAE